MRLPVFEKPPWRTKIWFLLGSDPAPPLPHLVAESLHLRRFALQTHRTTGPQGEGSHWFLVEATTFSEVTRENGCHQRQGSKRNPSTFLHQCNPLRQPGQPTGSMSCTMDASFWLPFRGACAKGSTGQGNRLRQAECPAMSNPIHPASSIAKDCQNNGLRLSFCLPLKPAEGVANFKNRPLSFCPNQNLQA